MINLNNISYVEIQRIKLDWYDGYGVQVQGASDHIWLANMLADSQVPNATVPIGFYIHPSGTPGDIHLYNTDAHRNYVGYRFDGTPGAIELKNCRAYANRTYGLMDETKFREGLGRIIDGAVECLNASAWAQRESASATN